MSRQILTVACVFILLCGAVHRAVMEDGVLNSVLEGMATLSTDARLIEDTTAAEFMQEFTRCITDPDNMLM